MKKIPEVQIDPAITQSSIGRRTTLVAAAPEPRMVNNIMQIPLYEVGILFFKHGVLEEVKLEKNLDPIATEEIIRALISKYRGEMVSKDLGISLSREFRLAYTLWEYQNGRKNLTYPAFRGRIEPFLQSGALPPTDLGSVKISEGDENG